MYFNADDLRALAGTLNKLDTLGGEFAGTLNFVTEGGNPETLEYLFDKNSQKHFIRFHVPASAG